MLVSHEEMNALHFGEAIVVLIVDDKRIVGIFYITYRYKTIFATTFLMPDAFIIAKALIAQHLECLGINVETCRH